MREWDDGYGNVFRFTVVPRKRMANAECGSNYPIARDIVTNSFTLEYADMPEITIKVLDIGDE